MRDEAIKSDILAALDIVAMERLDDGLFKLISTAPRWLAEFLPQAEGEVAQLRPQEAFMFLGQFLTEAESFWNSNGAGLLRSGVWSEAYAAAKDYNLEASALKVGERRLL